MIWTFLACMAGSLPVQPAALLYQLLCRRTASAISGPVRLERYLAQRHRFKMGSAHNRVLPGQVGQNMWPDSGMRQGIGMLPADCASERGCI